ncbi:MAG: phosphonoacetaldehyde hydrolase [Pirellulaceae bacterium]|nr:phosphonoacetaldehyde hydrolase [Planctomycetales bacterium]
MNSFRFQRRYRGGLQGVVFDWAGTTVDYGCLAPAVVFIDVFRKQGVEVTVEEAREPMGLHKLDHIRAISHMPSVVRRWQEVHGQAPEDSDVMAMYESFVPQQVAAVAKHTDIIPGTLETVAACRTRGLKIGSTTGYTGPIMDVVKVEAKQRGYEPDATVCATDVAAGRPEPWMCLRNAELLRIYPMEAVVKAGDTIADIQEGLNAGMWTIGFAKSGNEIGLSQSDIARLSADDYQRRLERAYSRMYQAGAHYVVDSIADMMHCLDDIEQRLARGETP